MTSIANCLCISWFTKRHESGIQKRIMLDRRVKQSPNMQIIYSSFAFSPLAQIHLQHNNTNPIHLRLIDLVVLIHATAELWRPPVEEVEVQLSVTGLELVVFEEERVVEERQGVEDVEAVLLGKDEGVVDERVQAGFEVCLDFVGGARGEGGFRGVVVEVGGADGFGGGGFEDGGLEGMLVFF